MNVVTVILEALSKIVPIVTDRFRRCIILDTRLFEPSIVKTKKIENHLVMIDRDSRGALFVQMWIRLVNPPFRPPNSIVRADLKWAKPLEAYVQGTWRDSNWPGVLFQSPVIEFPTYLQRGEAKEGWLAFKRTFPFVSRQPGTNIDNVVRLIVLDSYGHKHAKRIRLQFTL